MANQNQSPAGTRGNGRTILLLVAGVAAAVAAVAMARSGGLEVLRGVLVGLGLLATAVAITWRLPSAKVLLAAALVPFVASFAIDPSWDTVRLVFHLLAAVAVAGAGLFALPQRFRRLALSVLVVLHFGGIVTAVVSLPPPGADEPWLAGQVGARFYKPYLELMYLTNAYHFYAPEPGPETLLWFRIEYADGQSRWVKLPDSSKGRLGLAELRVGALADGVLETLPSTDLTDEFIDDYIEAGKRFEPPMPEPEDDPSSSYQEPVPEAKRLLKTFARHVATHYPHPTTPAQPVAGVKIYRVVHRLLSAQEFSAGLDPNDPTTYVAYYQGDFAANGKLKPSSFRVTRTSDGQVEVHQDPLLYWHLPIVRDSEGNLIDYVKLHAKSKKQSK